MPSSPKTKPRLPLYGEIWLQEWEKAAKFSNDADDLARVAAARRSYPKSGYRGAMKRVAELQEEQAKRIYIDPLFIAVNYAILGEKIVHLACWKRLAGKRAAASGASRLFPLSIRCVPIPDMPTCSNAWVRLSNNSFAGFKMARVVFLLQLPPSEPLFANT